jgi:hypothetical protein
VSGASGRAWIMRHTGGARVHRGGLAWGGRVRQ